MAYDPYGGQTTEQQLTIGTAAKEMALGAISPTTMLAPYTMWPGTYSTSKGIWTPFETRGSAWKKQIGLAREAWKGGKISGIKGTFKSAGNLFNPLGSGHRRFNNFLNTDYNKIIKEELHNVSISNIKANNQKMNIITMEKLGVNKSTLKNARSDYLKTFIESKRLGIKASESTKLLKSQNLLKWGIRGGKAVSAVGLTMLAWDIGSLVARPLAQAAMNTVGNIAKDYQNRFMPEMGGQLQLSYLSQGAATERQRSIQAISKSYINGRSAMGGEASMMHS